jgi:hypothetical protein
MTYATQPEHPTPPVERRDYRPPQDRPQPQR